MSYKKTRYEKQVKKRNTEKVIMDRYYHPKTFRSQKRNLEAYDAENEIQEFFNHED